MTNLDRVQVAYPLEHNVQFRDQVGYIVGMKNRRISVLIGEATHQFLPRELTMQVVEP